ncbi:MAG: amidase [Pseudomonadota bacterium]
MIPDLHAARQAIASGAAERADFLEAARVASHSGACAHVFLSSPEQALSTAMKDRSADAGAGVLAGLPVSIKDLFDVAGERTAAGSTVLADAPPALHDCPAVARLRQAGGLIAGRTNMVEFAFSGVGINPHFGTPVNPADPVTPRIPGGSSSGAAVSVATGAAFIGLGSDTGGSIRIPAALCGLVGFKNTARWVPRDGAIPLSTTLDTVCALTRSVRDAVTAHEVLAGRRVSLAARPLASLRLAVPRGVMLEGLDATVGQSFETSLRTLRAAGTQIEEIDLPELDELAGINATGGLSAAESYAWHRNLIRDHQGEYDHRVALRILRGATMSAADYIELLRARADWVLRMGVRLAPFDAVICPTVPFVAPPISALLEDDEFFRINGLLLRNPSIVNMLDGCAISLPCHSPDQLPAGLMLWHGALHDDALLDMSLQVEAALAKARST